MQNKSPLGLAISLSLLVLSTAPAVAAASGELAGAAAATELDRVEVRPQLESQTRAVDLKRSSDAIGDAVSSDAMGVYPDKNVAESLQRLPGVSVTRDRGEGRFVVVRGPMPTSTASASTASPWGPRKIPAAPRRWT